MNPCPAPSASHPGDRPDLTVVNVVAVSYSGSTWLNLMLGSHSRMFSVGEMDALLKWGRCWCTFHGDQCPHWSRFQLDSPTNPFVQLHQITGRRIFIVNNARRYLPAQQHRRIRRLFLWVVRDGRAVMASTLRKYPHLSTGRAAWRWVRAHRKKQRLIAAQPPDDTRRFHYEHIRHDPQSALAEICRWIGVDYEPPMLEFWKLPHCFIAGNDGPILQIARYQNISLPVMDKQLHRTATANKTPGKIEQDRNFYEQQNPAHFRDERWKSELTDRQLRLFALLAGRLNRRLGYPPSTCRRGLLDAPT